MEPPIGEKPRWISYVSDVCGCSRSKVSALCRIARQGCRVSDRTHMSGVRSPQNLLLLRVFVSSLLLSHKCKDSRGPSADPPHQQKSRGQAEISPLTVPVFHSFTCTNTHSYTDTVIQCPRSQPLASSRCLKTGGTSVPDSPSSPLPLATFVGKRLAVKSNRQTASQLPRPHHQDTKFL